MYLVTGRQTSVPAADLAVHHELTLVLLGHGPGAPGEHCLRQSPTDETVFVEVQVSSGEVPVHHWRKGRETSLDALESSTESHAAQLGVG